VDSVVFARPRWDYQSYSDLWQLVKLSGYPLIYIDEMDFESDNTYIFSTPATDWWHGWPNAKCRIIYLNIEWYLDAEYENIPCVETWSTDAWYAKLKKVRYVPMGSHPALNPHPDDTPEKTYDVATLWAGSYNRYHAEDLIERSHLTRAPNGWGEERHRILSQSRVMTAVHQYPEARTIAPQRWALAAAYKLPIISERLEDAGMLDTVTIQCDLEDIGIVAASWKEPANLGKLAAKGRSLYGLLCEQYTFRVGIERAL